MALTGDPLTALASQGDIQVTNGTTGSTTYTSTLTGGVACGTAFVAPASGVVNIHYTSEVNNTGGYTFATIRVRTGGVVGSGSDFLAVSDNDAVFHNTNIRVGATRRLAGLAAGSTYNVQLLHKVTAGTGTVGKKEVGVTPLP